VEVGDVVLALGNPFGVGQSVSKGIISALGRQSGILGMGGYEDFIQTDAPINVGNSGGALVDSDGRLIGVNQSIASLSGANAGVGFAVPVNLARAVLEQIIADGSVRRGQLGVGIGPVNEDIRTELKLPDTSGAIVTGVLKDSAAAKAGLKPYDVITAVNGKKVSDHSHLRFAIAQLRPKSKVTLTIIRDSKEKSIEAVLDESSTRLAASGGVESNEPAADNADVLKGVTLGELDSRIRKQRKIPADVQGVLVTRVDAEAPASDQLQAGDVIVEVNREPVATADEVRKLAGAGKGRRVMLRVWTDSDGSGFTRLIFLNGR
jgi:S1-C subfamily serine protease